MLILLLSSAEAQDAPQDLTPPSSSVWTIPSSETIRNLLADRIDRQRQDVGIVVGVIEPAGRRVISYGESGAPDSRPLDGDTVFWIGSVTKVFTTLLLADMAQRGELALDDALQTHLPEATLAPRERPITLRDLATHFSGLPSMPTNFDLAASPNPYQAYSIDDLHQFLATHELERSSGGGAGSIRI